MNKVKELREQKKIRQADLAKELSVSQGTLSNWERGVHDPDNASLIKLSEIFQCSIDYLLGKSDNPNPQPQRAEKTALDALLADYPTTENYVELMRIVNTLSKEKREPFIAAMLNFAKILLVDEDGNTQK